MIRTFSKEFILFIACLSFGNGLAQTTSKDNRYLELVIIDSLKAALNHYTDPHQIIDLQCDLAYEYTATDLQKALECSKVSYRDAKLLGDSLKMVSAGRMVLSAHRRLNNNDSATWMGNEILQVARRNQFVNEVLAIINPLSDAYVNLGQYDSALRLNFERLEASYKMNNIPSYQSLNNIGFIFYKIKNYEKALLYFNMALQDWFQSVKIDSADYALIAINKSLSLVYLDRCEESSRIIKSIVYSHRNCTDDDLSNAFYALGLNNLRQGEYESATVNFETSIIYGLQANNFRLVCDSYIGLAKASKSEGNELSAKRFLYKSLAIADPLMYSEILLTAYEELLILKSLSIREKATIQGNYIDLKESKYNTMLREHLAKQEAEFYERNNAEQIKYQKEELVFLEDLKELQFYIIVVITIVLLVVIFILFSIYRLRNWKIRLKLKLERGFRSREMFLLQEISSATTKKKHYEKLLFRIRQHSEDSFDQLLT
ncbi:MAG: tetratricopeptide repeat protein [Cyclobacteriaceae bacterium]|nr:MAG: tetratricopeptide repeat protein [Cyclobacteriaceae bacterium]